VVNGLAIGFQCLGLEVKAGRVFPGEPTTLQTTVSSISLGWSAFT
jgi:hypothetical protein